MGVAGDDAGGAEVELLTSRKFEGWWRSVRRPKTGDRESTTNLSRVAIDSDGVGTVTTGWEDYPEEQYGAQSKIVVAKHTLTWKVSGETYTGKLESGNIVWSDGDVWESLAYYIIIVYSIAK